MNLFIDANIFLDFYHLSGGDIGELQKLVNLIENGDIVLFSCPQLREEIKRNRDAKISDSMKGFANARFKVAFPAFCKHYPEYKQIQEKLTEANKKHSELVEKAKKEVVDRCLPADLLIKELLDKAKEIGPTNEMFNAALMRFRLGTPPGKKKVTLGDEMNWEALLAEVPSKEDLIFISGDGDFCSPIDSNALNAFLQEEWEHKKKSEVIFYRTLSDFLEAKFPQIHLASDVKTAGLVERLSMSGSFATTHAVIASLSKQSDFPKHQVEELIAIAELNTQVGWIMSDTDVFEFYKGILEKYGLTMEPNWKTKLEEILAPHKEQLETEAEDEIPPRFN